MATSIIPVLVDAVIAKSGDALTDVKVYDGYGISEDPGDFLMVGVDDPDSEIAAAAVDAEQSWANIGHVTRDESGELTCVALSWNGNANAKAARDGAFGVATKLEDLLRADPTLGLGPQVRVEFGSQLQLTQQQAEGGASALLIFKLRFDARI